MSLLPLQGANEVKPWSLARDTQLRTVLEAGLGAVLLPGFLPGLGTVTQSGPNEITVAAGAAVWTQGVAYTLPAALLRSGFGNGTNYVWGLLARTAANQAVKTALDTYALSLSHVLGDPTPPSALHIPAAVLTVAGGVITALVEPGGKYARPVTPPPGTAAAAAGAATLHAPAGVVTSEALTTAAGAEYVLTLSNSLVTAGSVVVVSLAWGSNTVGPVYVSRVTPGAGSVTIRVLNAHPSSALNGTLRISYFVAA